MLKPHQIRKILKLREEGFTYKDIAKRVGASVSSVKKYVKLNRQKLEAESAFQPFVKGDKPLEQIVMENRVMIKKMVELLCSSEAGLFNNALTAHIYGEDQDTCISETVDAEIEMWRRIFDIDAELGKKLLIKQKPYEAFLEPINEKERQRKAKWIEFVKKHCPELLAEFV